MREDLIPIGEACRLLHRSEDTLRRWAARGFAANGMKLAVFRDTCTKTRYFQRDQIERIAAAVFVAA